jgi:hypothetical protein
MYSVNRCLKLLYSIATIAIMAAAKAPMPATGVVAAPGNSGRGAVLLPVTLPVGAGAWGWPSLIRVTGAPVGAWGWPSLIWVMTGAGAPVGT